MFYDDTIAGNWTALIERLDARSALVEWGAVEPDLTGLSCVEALVPLVAEHAEPVRSDAVIGSLVRLAAAEGGNDEDALLLLLHLLSQLALSLARELKDLSPDILRLVVGELTCQIRAYLRRGRTRAWAANLRLDTRRAVLADVLPRVRNHPDWGDVLTDDGDAAQMLGTIPGPGDDPDLNVIDLLRWAVCHGVDAVGVGLLVETEYARDQQPEGADRRIAARHGVCERTLYRRRRRTLAELRIVAVDYLAAVA